MNVDESAHEIAVTVALSKLGYRSPYRLDTGQLLKAAQAVSNTHQNGQYSSASESGAKSQGTLVDLYERVTAASQRDTGSACRGGG